MGIVLPVSMTVPRRSEHRMRYRAADGPERARPSAGQASWHGGLLESQIFPAHCPGTQANSSTASSGSKPVEIDYKSRIEIGHGSRGTAARIADHSRRSDAIVAAVVKVSVHPDEGRMSDSHARELPGACRAPGLRQQFGQDRKPARSMMGDKDRQSRLRPAQGVHQEIHVVAGSSELLARERPRRAL